MSARTCGSTERRSVKRCDGVSGSIPSLEVDHRFITHPSESPKINELLAGVDRHPARREGKTRQSSAFRAISGRREGPGSVSRIMVARPLAAAG